MSLTIEKSAIIDKLLNELKSRYRIEILEYDTRGKHLDDTVFIFVLPSNCGRL